MFLLDNTELTLSPPSTQFGIYPGSSLGAQVPLIAFRIARLNLLLRLRNLSFILGPLNRKSKQQNAVVGHCFHWAYKYFIHFLIKNNNFFLHFQACYNENH